MGRSQKESWYENCDLVHVSSLMFRSSSIDVIKTIEWSSVLFVESSRTSYRSTDQLPDPQLCILSNTVVSLDRGRWALIQCTSATVLPWFSPMPGLLSTFEPNWSNGKRLPRIDWLIDEQMRYYALLIWIHRGTITIASRMFSTFS